MRADFFFSKGVVSCDVWFKRFKSDFSLINKRCFGSSRKGDNLKELLAETLAQTQKELAEHS